MGVISLYQWKLKTLNPNTRFDLIHSFPPTIQLHLLMLEFLQILQIQQSIYSLLKIQYLFLYLKALIPIDASVLWRLRLGFNHFSLFGLEALRFHHLTLFFYPKFMMATHRKAARKSVAMTRHKPNRGTKKGLIPSLNYTGSTRSKTRSQSKRDKTHDTQDTQSTPEAKARPSLIVTFRVRKTIDLAENYATSTSVDFPRIIQSAVPIKTNQANGKGPITAFPIVRNFDLIQNGDLHDKPPAWADARQSLCDSLPWYRAVQGSCYNHSGICYGFLIDEDCGSGFYMDEEVIITRVGGSYSKVDGELRLNKDQSLARFPARALQRSKADKLPVGLIIGNKNSLLGPTLQHRYAVLAYFRITDIWYEKIDTYAGLKIRFEKLDLLEKSWWAAKDSPNPLPYEARNPLTVAKPEVIKCLHCLQPSPRAFERGWMCLTHHCARFWKIGNTNQPENLTYHSTWLSTRQNPRDDENTQNPMQEPSGPLIPDHAQVLRESNEIDTTHRLSWRGLVCPWCRKCLSRTLWEGWKCNSDPKIEDLPDTCKFEMMIQLMPVPASLVLRQHEPVPGIPRPGLNVDLVSCLPYHKYTYEFPGVGSLTQFRANQSIQEVPGGPNDLFESLQKEPLGLKRYPLQSSVVNKILTSHFAVNYGMPYKYVVSVASKGFSEAPDAILRSLGRLTWATEKAVTAAGGVFQPPNELLTLGYFEGMKIGYHDDGEIDLGPTIATLSLGASSTMSLRMKPKYYHGRSKSGVLPQDDIVLPGCKLEKRRLTLKKQFEEGRINRDAYDRRRATAFQHENLTGQAPASVVMNLHHGDLVVMHGENLQKYFEHSVISNDLLRFALTARYIKPDSVNRSEIAKGDFTLIPDQAYNGD